jgi:hypothetical protein
MNDLDLYLLFEGTVSAPCEVDEQPLSNIMDTIMIILGRKNSADGSDIAQGQSTAADMLCGGLTEGIRRDNDECLD